MYACVQVMPITSYIDWVKLWAQKNCLLLFFFRILFQHSLKFCLSHVFFKTRRSATKLYCTWLRLTVHNLIIIGDMFNIVLILYAALYLVWFWCHTLTTMQTVYTVIMKIKMVAWFHYGHAGDIFSKHTWNEHLNDDGSTKDWKVFCTKELSLLSLVALPFIRNEFCQN